LHTYNIRLCGNVRATDPDVLKQHLHRRSHRSYLACRNRRGRLHSVRLGPSDRAGLRGNVHEYRRQRGSRLRDAVHVSDRWQGRPEQNNERLGCQILGKVECYGCSGVILDAKLITCPMSHLKVYDRALFSRATKVSLRCAMGTHLAPSSKMVGLSWMPYPAF
jgi:hypothetical protein